MFDPLTAVITRTVTSSRPRIIAHRFTVCVDSPPPSRHFLPGVHVVGTLDIVDGQSLVVRM